MNTGWLDMRGVVSGGFLLSVGTPGPFLGGETNSMI